VLVFARDVVFFGNGFGREAHIEVVVRFVGGNGIGRHGLPSGLGHHGHAFGAACDDTIGKAAADLGGCHCDGLETAGTVAVDGNTRGMDTNGPGGYDAADLEALLRLGYGVAHDHVVDSFRVEVGDGF